MGNINIAFSANSHKSIVEYLKQNMDTVGILPYYSQPVLSALENKQLHKIGNYLLSSDLFLLTSVEETVPLRKKVLIEYFLENSIS